MAKQKTKNIVKHVLIGKGYESIERAKRLKNELLADGWTIAKENSKKIFFTKRVKC